MKKIDLSQILKACNGEIYNCENPENVMINNITTDSRNIKKHCLFIPLKGESFDGHDFIEKAFLSGAVCSLSEKNLNITNTYIKVNSCYQAIKDIAEFYRTLFDIPFIGITGSVGKTSTKEMVAAVLGQKLKVHKTQGNFNNELGVPLTLFGLEEHHQVAVIEMGISGFGEMSRLSKMVKPDICIITNIGDCHLENLIDKAGVRKAKTEMFEYLNKNGKVFLNGDDDYLKEITNVNGQKPIFFGLNKGNQYFAAQVENKGADGISATLCYEKKQMSVTIPAIGNYMVLNALVAVAVGKYLELSDEEIAKGIKNYKTVGSRDGLIKTDFLTIIDDCYNANPNSVKGSIDTLLNFKGRKVCILGDMKELGEKSVELHKSVGEYAADKNVDLIITIGEQAKEIAIAAKAKGVLVKSFNTVEDSEKQLSSLLQKGDCVLVKASRAMRFEKVVALLKTF